jgi:hypothetical protein
MRGQSPDIHHVKVQIHDEIFSCNFGLMIQKFHEQLAGDNILCYMFQCFMSLTSVSTIKFSCSRNFCIMRPKLHENISSWICTFIVLFFSVGFLNSFLNAKSERNERNLLADNEITLLCRPVPGTL